MFGSTPWYNHYEIKLLERSKIIKNGFIVPEVKDTAFLQEKDIAYRIMLPQFNAKAQTKRLNLFYARTDLYLMFTESSLLLFKQTQKFAVF